MIINRKRIKEELIPDKCFCNACGKEVYDYNTSYYGPNVASLKVHWGYGSKKDGEFHSFDICESCYDKIVRTFRIPPQIEDYGSGDMI